VLLFVANNYIDVVGAFQTVIGNAEQGIGIRRQINTAHVRAFVHDHIEETGILVSEPVVVLAPHGGSDEQVKRGHGRAQYSSPQVVSFFG
jgi:hypothetical protein